MNAAVSWAALDHAGFAAMRLLLAALWQSSILLAAVGALAWALRKRRASVRHVLWVGGLLLAPMLPFIAAAALRTGAPQVPVRVLPAYVETSDLPPARIETPPPASAYGPTSRLPAPVPATSKQSAHVSVFTYPWALLLTAYVIGAVAFLAWIVAGRFRIRRWVKSAHPPMDDRVLAAFKVAAQTAGLPGNFRVLESGRVPTSVSCGVLHPVVLLPKGLAARLSDAELRALAIHEMAHVRRKDVPVLTVVSLLRAVLFFHPLVWLAARQISILAEQAADDAVLEATGEPIPYAKLLARFAEELPRRAVSAELTAGILFSRSAFLRRVEAILSDRRAEIRRFSRIALAATVLAAVLSLAVAIVVPLEEKGTAPVVRTPDSPPGADNTSDGPYENVEPVKAGPVSGRIIAPPGTQLPVVCVENTFATLRGPRGLAESAGVLSKARVNPDMTFSGNGYYAGSLSFMAVAPGLARAHVGPVKLAPGQALKDVEIRMDAGFNGRVKVTSKAGPHPTAGIVAGGLKFHSSQEEPPFPEIPVPIDKEGMATIPNCSSYSTDLAVYAPGFQPATYSYVALAQRKAITLEVEPAGPLARVRVLDARTGAPVNRAEARFVAHLTCYPGDPKSTQIVIVPPGEGLVLPYCHERDYVMGVSDERGRLDIDMLSPGQEHTYWASVCTPGYGLKVVGPFRAGEDLGDVKLDAPLAITGEIRGPAAMLADASLSLSHFSKLGCTDTRGQEFDRTLQLPARAEGDRISFSILNLYPCRLQLRAIFPKNRIPGQPGAQVKDDIDVVNLGDGKLTRCKSPKGVAPYLIEYNAELKESVSGLVINLLGSPGEKAALPAGPTPSAPTSLENPPSPLIPDKAASPTQAVIKDFRIEGDRWILSAAEARLKEGGDFHLILPVLEQKPSGHVGGKPRSTIKADEGILAKGPPPMIRMSGHLMMEDADGQSPRANALELNLDYLSLSVRPPKPSPSPTAPAHKPPEAQPTGSAPAPPEKPTADTEGWQTNEAPWPPNAKAVGPKGEEGVLFGIWVDKLIWNAEETPLFGADLSHVGKREIQRLGAYELALDGVSYVKSPEDNNSPQVFGPEVFRPQTSYRDMYFALDAGWRNKQSGRPLALAPGRHLIRLAFNAQAGDDRVRILSNVVEFQILAPGEKATEDEWFKLAAGARPGSRYSAKQVAEMYRKENGKELPLEELAKLCSKQALALSQTGPDPALLADAVEKALAVEQDDAVKAKLFVFLGDAYQLQTRKFSPALWGRQRRIAAEAYFLGLQVVLRHILTVSSSEHAGTNEDNRETAAAKEAERIEELVRQRPILAGQIVEMYARPPDAEEELRGLVMKFIGNEKTATEMVSAARAGRKNWVRPIPPSAAKLPGNASPPPVEKPKQAQPSGSAPALHLTQDSPIADLITGLESDDIDQWSRATTFLGMRGKDARPAVPAVVRALERENVRESALHTLWQLGPVAEEAIPALIKAITAYPHQPACREIAAEALANIGPAALPALKRAAGSEEPVLKIWACAALVKSEGPDSPSLRFLANTIQGDNTALAEEALSAVTVVGPPAAPIVPQLKEAMKTSHIWQSDMRFMAAFRQIGPGAESAMPQLLTALKSGNESEKLEAIRAVNKMPGPSAKAAVPLLIETLDAEAAITATNQPCIREEAARALGKFGPDAREAIPALVKALDDPTMRVREAAVIAIGRINPADPQALPGLIKAMRDPSPVANVRYAANETLLKAGPVNIEVIRAFIRAVRENARDFGEWREGFEYSGPSGDIVIISRGFFGRLGPEHRYAVPDFVAMAKDPHSGVQQIAFEALARIGEVPEEFIPVLIEHLPDYVAANALKAMGPKAKAAVPQLIAMMKTDRRQREAAAGILASFGRPAADSAIPAFERCAQDAGYPYRNRICFALLKLDPSSTVALDACEKIIATPQKNLQDSWEVMAAHALLAQSGRDPQAHLRFLTEQLQGPDERLCGAVAQLILECHAQGKTRAAALDRIFQLMETGKDEWSVERAAQGLPLVGPEDKAYVPQLIRVISQPPRGQRVEALVSAVAALGRIGPAAKEALPQLKALLQYQAPAIPGHEDLDFYGDYEASCVRKAAEESIRKIEPVPGASNPTPSPPGSAPPAPWVEKQPYLWDGKGRE